MAISDRGFASMDPNKKREIQSMGGRASGGGKKSESSSTRGTGAGRGSNLTQADRSKGGKNSHR